MNRLTNMFAVFMLMALRSAEASCTTGDIVVIGSSGANRFAKVWADGFKNECSDTIISIQDETDSSMCNTNDDFDIFTSEVSTEKDAMAVTDNGWEFDCDERFSTIQIEVGSEGVVLATGNQGVAAECIEIMGGLSVDQVRWMYTSMSESQLLSTDKWKAAAIPNSDGNDATHLWSELHSECAPVEIVLYGEPEETTSADYFVDRLYKDISFGSLYMRRYNSPASMKELVESLENNELAIGFFGIQYALSKTEQELIKDLNTVSLRETNIGGTLASPTVVGFDDGFYALANRVYMNLINDPTKLAIVRPFIEFGFSKEGAELLRQAGLWPILEWEQMVMKTKAQTETGIPMEEILKSCSYDGASITVMGSNTVHPVAEVWSAVYEVGCNLKFSLEKGGSQNGAYRVCGDLDRGVPLDIGNMSREWKDDEAFPRGESTIYDCVRGDKNRSIIQVPVAIDGLTIATQISGPARECVDDILGGLTTDQLRWIFSSYSEDQLEATGWDPASIANSDGNPNTSLWSELDARCQPVQIQAGGQDIDSGTFVYFTEAILYDHKNGEAFNENYQDRYDPTQIVAFLQETPEAIAYFGYSYFYDFRDNLFAIAVQNSDGIMVSPTESTITDGSYNPMARRIYMNLHNTEKALKKTVPFMVFGLQNSQKLVPTTGYVPIADSIAQYHISILESAPYTLDSDDGLSAGGITGIVIVVIVALLIGGCLWLRSKGSVATAPVVTSSSDMA